MEAGTRIVSLRTLLTAGPLGFPTLRSEPLDFCVVFGLYMEALLLVVSSLSFTVLQHYVRNFLIHFVVVMFTSLDRCQCNGPLYNRMFTDCGTLEQVELLYAFWVQVTNVELTLFFLTI